MSALEWAGALALLAALWLTGRVAYRRGYRKGFSDGGDVTAELAARAYGETLAKQEFFRQQHDSATREVIVTSGPERTHDRQAPGTDVMP